MSWTMAGCRSEMETVLPWLPGFGPAGQIADRRDEVKKGEAMQFAIDQSPTGSQHVLPGAESAQ